MPGLLASAIVLRADEAELLRKKKEAFGSPFFVLIMEYGTQMTQILQMTTDFFLGYAIWLYLKIKDLWSSVKSVSSVCH